MSTSAQDIQESAIAGRIGPQRDARRVLMLTHRLPFPPDRGDRIRSYHLLRELSHHFDVSLASVSDEPVNDEQRAVIKELTGQFHVHRISQRAAKCRAAAALLAGKAGTPDAFFRESLARRVMAWHNEDPFDAILTFCTGMVRYARVLNRHSHPRPRHVLDLVDVDSLKWKAYSKQTRWPQSHLYAKEAERLVEIEGAKHDHFDAITVISDAEAEAYQQNISSEQNLHVVRNGVDLNYFHAMPDAISTTIAFIGVLDYPPNIEAMEWFIAEALPMLRERCGNVRLNIAGRRPTKRIMKLDGQPNVSVLGPVNDVREVLRTASVIIAPLRTARGVQNKVLEAMACARTVIVSPQALEGIHATPGEHLVLAETPRQWADYAFRLIEDVETRGRIASAARKQVERYYDWSSAIAPMIDLVRGRQTTNLRAAS